MTAKKTVKLQDVSLYPADDSVARPRLHKLIIRNFCAIGEAPVEIELDDIVVLVGPNNAGKSSILRAYEVVMSHGSKDGHLSLEDFPGGVVTQDAWPEIELQTIVHDNSPGERWIAEDASKRIVRERWRWTAPGAPTRQGYDVAAGSWSDNVPWGAPNVANSRRPQPHRVDAFASPEKQNAAIVDLLTSILQDRVRSHRSQADQSADTTYSRLLRSIGELQTQIVEESAEELAYLQENLSSAIADVFPNYIIKFDAKPEDDLDKSVLLFKSAPQLLMGHKDGYLSTVSRQGSGARRTLLWSALRIVKDYQTAKTNKGDEARPHVLLLDEPELCLHPNAIREARRVLYNLPSMGNWQVMITTHSPVFIDLSQDNTTIVRVERGADGAVTGKTLFRPERARLDEDDRRRLKMLNICDPYVNEFFFGGKIVVVEGDTEYTAFRFIAERAGEEFHDLQVIRARGKATITSLVKVLNHFGVKYSVLHDSDLPMMQLKDGSTRRNSAWTANEAIREAVVAAPDPTRVNQVASVPNFESAFLGEEVQGDKPYNALMRIEESQLAYTTLLGLLRSLVNFDAAPPASAVRWTTLGQLEEAVLYVQRAEQSTYLPA